VRQKLTLFYAWEHGMGCMKPMPKEEELQQMPGRGKLDWKPLLAALKQINFTGPTEIFMHPRHAASPSCPPWQNHCRDGCAKQHLDAIVKSKSQVSNSQLHHSNLMPEAKVLLIVGDATETVDTLYPFYRLIEGGYKPVVAAPEKRKYQMVLHEVKPGWTITKEWEGYSIDADIAFKDINPEEYVGIFFSGGRAPEYIREDADLLRITKWFWEQKKPCASVCHGVEIPARADIVKGLRMATVAKCKFDLEICGGIYVNEPCVIDQHMYSGRTYHDSGHFIGPWIKALDAERAKMGI
jgi:protease I